MTRTAESATKADAATINGIHRSLRKSIEHAPYVVGDQGLELFTSAAPADRAEHMQFLGQQDVVWRGSSPYQPGAESIEISLATMSGAVLRFRMARAEAATLREALSEALYGHSGDQSSNSSGMRSNIGLPQDGQEVSPLAIA